ncbi:MAG TPA: tetratricopeptide repeat protein [Isosphaeraceae bacterium]|jgi:tetratricopeptide (TPR) repeat protein|nr:tetratricopeptide repeat protein [Isosphaeraceae bacterium]
MRSARVVLGLLLATAFGLATPPARAQSPTLHDPREMLSNRLRFDALALYKQSRYADALPYFDEILKRQPRDLEVRIKRANIYIRKNDPMRALPEYEWVMRYNPTIPGPYTDRGIIHLMYGRYDQALSDFQRAIALYGAPGFLGGGGGYGPGAGIGVGLGMGFDVSPMMNKEKRLGKAGAHDGAGQVYLAWGRYDEAIAQFDAALSIAPKEDANAYSGRGTAHAFLGKFDQALADFNAAIAIDPRHSRALGGRGAALADLGRIGEARRDFEAALKLDPTFDKGYELIGVLDARLGRNEDALKDFDAWIKAKPSSAEARKDKGGVLVRLGRYEEAVKVLDEAIRLDPKRAGSFKNRAAAFLGLGKFEMALADCDAALKLAPPSAGTLSTKGAAALALEQYERAVVELDAAIELDPKDATARRHRGEALARLGRYEKAMEDLEIAVLLDPDGLAARVTLAKVLGDAGKYDEAIKDLDAAILLKPADADLLAARGHLRRALGDWKGAIADYSAALKIDPRRADVYAARGWTMLAAGLDGADVDARAYIDLEGGRDPNAPHMALLGALGARRAGREREARDFLAEAAANADPAAWPAPAISYLKRDRDVRWLLESARDFDQRSEAHVLVALDLLQSHDRDGAIAHLRWVRGHATRRSIVTDLARGLLVHLDTLPEPEPPTTGLGAR